MVLKPIKTAKMKNTSTTQDWQGHSQALLAEMQTGNLIYWAAKEQVSTRHANFKSEKSLYLSNVKHSRIHPCYDSHLNATANCKKKLE